MFTNSFGNQVSTKYHGSHPTNHNFLCASNNVKSLKRPLVYRIPIRPCGLAPQRAVPDPYPYLRRSALIWMRMVLLPTAKGCVAFVRAAPAQISCKSDVAQPQTRHKTGGLHQILTIDKENLGSAEARSLCFKWYGQARRNPQRNVLKICQLSQIQSFWASTMPSRTQASYLHL